MNNKSLAIGIILLFIITSVSPIVIGYNNETRERDIEQISKSIIFNKVNKHNYPEEYSTEKFNFIKHKNDVNSDELPFQKKAVTQFINKGFAGDSSEIVGDPMDSAWPMYCHDVRHTGRSPYSTIDTWDEVWKFKTYGWAANSPAIDENGIIYIGAYRLYAVYPNGTLKWELKTDGVFESSCPAIDESGIIYVGTFQAGYYLYAIYPNGTLKWKYPIGGMCTSPAIANDGTIIFSDTDNWNIIALYPNGTEKWKYHTNHVIYSSPAIGLDGTIYCGAHDNYVYALFPNNGTLRWKFKTGAWVHGSPTIANDGTVYIGSDDGYLYALYPHNGTMKWTVNIGAVYGSLALDKDGTIYVGVWEKTFYAIYPNGTIKWSFNTGGGKVWGSSPALSDDDTIYFGTCDLEWTGGIEIIALYTDGTVKWRKGLDTVFSSPAIGEDGAVYIGSCGEPGAGFLNAFGRGELEADANGPYYGLINEPVQFTGYSKGGYSPHTFHWDFGDENYSEEQNPTHTYTEAGNYTVTLTVTDNTSNSTSDTTWALIIEENNPPGKPTITGETDGKFGESYDYTFVATDPEDNDVRYYIDWGDNQIEEWIGPYPSGQEVVVSHTWEKRGTYTITAKAKDIFEAVGEEGSLTVKMPINKMTTDSLFVRFLDRFPNAFPIFRQIFGL